MDRHATIEPENGQEIPVFLPGGDLETDPARPIAIEQDATIANHPIAQIGRSLIENHEIDSLFQRRFEAGP